MPMASLKTLLAISLVLGAVTLWSTPAYAQLSPNFYESVCPQALPTIKLIVWRAIVLDRRMGASLLRLHFHDCFVNGCDGSILLDDTPNFRGEKTAFPNVNSVRGFDVVDQIKNAVNTVCGANVVSCADILAVAARDSVEILGGSLFHYNVLLGRRDSTNASWDDANNNLPGPFSSFSQLLSNFQSHGLNLKDLVVLSGGHSIGLAKCSSYRNRIYSDANIAPGFAASLQNMCPLNGGDSNLAPLDPTPARFDNWYYNALLNRRGLLHSDQELFKGVGSESDKLVVQYSRDPFAFARDFGASMIKMGNIKPLTVGQVRANCRKVN